MLMVCLFLSSGDNDPELLREIIPAMEIFNESDQSSRNLNHHQPHAP
jgi:hypothetical protein